MTGVQTCALPICTVFQNPLSRTLQVAPNPTTGWIEVSLPQQEGVFLTVYNLNGQKIKNLSIAPETPKISLDLGQNPTGLYWMVLSDAIGKVICSTKVSVSH